MVGILADLETDSASADRTDDPMNVVRIHAVEQHEKTAVLVAQAPVQLNGEAMRFLSGQIIVMERDSLSGHQPVRHQIDPIVQLDVEKRAQCGAKRRKTFRRRQPRNVLWKSGVEHAELVLLVEIGFHQSPRRAGFEPFEKRRFKVRREAMPREEVAERSGVELYFRVFAQERASHLL